MTTTDVNVTQTGGRAATTRHIPPKLALAVGMPSTPAPKGWRWSPLTDLARLESGHTPSRRHPEYWGGDIPWISIQDARANDAGRIEATSETTNELGIENSSARVLPTNTVCLSRTASVGYVVVMGRPMATSQDFVNWICSPNLDPRFLQYLFIAEGDDLLRFASGAVHNTIYFPEVKAFHVCHPPLAEQQRITGVLDEALADAATAKANAEKNLKNARALFASELNAVFTRRGEGWEERPLGEICDRVSVGHVGPTSEFYCSAEEGIPFLRSQNVRRGHLDWTGLQYVTKAFHVKLRKSQLKPGDLLFVRVGANRGDCCAVPDDVGEINCANIVFARPKLGNAVFLSRYCESSQGRAQLLGMTTGAAQGVINTSSVAELIVPLASAAKQQEIVESLFEFESETQRLRSIYQRKVDALDELKKSLLHEAFSGKL